MSIAFPMDLSRNPRDALEGPHPTLPHPLGPSAYGPAALFLTATAGLNGICIRQ